VNKRQEDARQTFLYSATMVADYSQLYTKDEIFGKNQPSDFNILEISTQPNSKSGEEQDGFKMTVANLE